MLSLRNLRNLNDNANGAKLTSNMIIREARALVRDSFSDEEWAAMDDEEKEDLFEIVEGRCFAHVRYSLIHHYSTFLII